MAACLLRAASYLLPSLLGKRMFLIFFLFLRGQFTPSDVPDFVWSSFPLLLHFLGRPEFAALSPSPAARVKSKEGSLSCLLPCIHRVYHLTGILPSTFRFWHGLLLPFSFSVTRGCFFLCFYGFGSEGKNFNKHQNKDTVKVKKDPHIEPKDVHSFGHVLERPLYFCARGNDCF